MCRSRVLRKLHSYSTPEDVDQWLQGIAEPVPRNQQWQDRRDKEVEHTDHDLDPRAKTRTKPQRRQPEGSNGREQPNDDPTIADDRLDLW